MIGLILLPYRCAVAVFYAHTYITPYNTYIHTYIGACMRTTQEPLQGSHHLFRSTQSYLPTLHESYMST